MIIILPIIQKLLTKVNYTRYSNRKIEYLVIHYTGNNGDTAKANCNYFLNTNRQASAHYFVDKNSIWQCVEDENAAWHCGCAKPYIPCKNSNSIGIELCSRRHPESGEYYFEDAVVDNAIELTKYLMEKYDIDVKHVVRHYDVSHKICPRPFVYDDEQWERFLYNVSSLKEKEEMKKNDRKGETEEMKYDSIEEIPSYAKETIEKLIAKGYLKGNDTGLNLSEDMVRMLVINDRAGIYGE